MTTRKRNKLGNDPLGWMDPSSAAREPGSDEAPSERPASDEAAPETKSGPKTETPKTNKPARRRTSAARHTNKPSEDTPMAANPQTDAPETDPNEMMDGRFMRAACEGSQMAVMMCDDDMNIIYANEAVVSLLRKRRHILQQHFPSFDPDNLVGQSIDQFHKDPSHQRAILSNPARMPYTAEIEVGGLEFKLQASGITDDNGRIIGSMVEWQDVTEWNEADRERARFAAAINGASSSLMMCDENMTITFANAALTAMFQKHREAFTKAFPGFDPYNMVGQSIDQFHSVPSHQHSILKDPSRLPYETEISLGDLRFWINATAIIDDDGNYAGNMLEWRDVTEMRTAEAEIDALIRDAASGNLGERLETERYSGFTQSIAESLNELLDAVVPPVREGSRVMQAMAEGDLSVRMQGEFRGEFAEFRDAIHTSLENLDQLVGQILEGAGNVRSASAEIAQGNTDLSQRTEEQASSLEETASSMEEMTSTVKSNADNAKQANQLASAARDKAQEGGEVVDKAVTAMGEINQSSKKIADIIGVIDEIAFQTNLLALNAAVEAARAGEQGRGFAVVATEVRNLAQRSAQAAKEIKTLINDSVERIGEGSKLVDNSGKALEDIVDSVKKVSDIIAEIAAASEEQSTGLDEINKAVTQLDEVTQQNAALVEEAAAASESLDDQSRELLELMSFFKGEQAAAAGQAMRQPSARPAPAGAPAQSGASALKRPTSASGNAASKRPAPAPSRQEASEEWEEF
ncbi:MULTISPECIES: methyl-accepting chemotaxis protein [unclassified Thioalkalivibrio]|uniref:methyl-accepting chemotaxis protein n=1 Tax=unclassified Thioalkalivibrio TaxID=2621013 RepID=UPI000381B4DE|nr:MULTISPECIES: methyl-accepting chemotaxis protein [unclassified Thioalkalivibrio]